MEVICSICRCAIGGNPPVGSTDLADLCPELKTPDLQDGSPVDENAPDIVSTPCGHLFHNSCLTQWYLMIGSRRCPLCNYVTPVHRMMKIFPTIERHVEATCSSTAMQLSDETMEEDHDGGGDTETIIEGYRIDASEPERQIFSDVDPSNQDSGEPASLQVTETTINGIRTMVYHFRPLPNPTEMLERPQSSLPDQAQSSSTSTRRRETAIFRSRSRRHCVGCANFSRIQALMTSDLTDLRNLVAEQAAVIESLQETIGNMRAIHQATNV